MATKTATPPTATKVKNFEDWRRLHDKNFIVPNKIREGLKALGPQGWEYEQEFMKRGPISQTDISRFRDQFEAHIALVDGGKKRIYCGSPALAAKMRASV